MKKHEILIKKTLRESFFLVDLAICQSPGELFFGGSGTTESVCKSIYSTCEATERNPKGLDPHTHFNGAPELPRTTTGNQQRRSQTEVAEIYRNDFSKKYDGPTEAGRQRPHH